MSSQLSKDLASLRIQRDSPKRSGSWGKVLVALGLAGAAGVGYVYGRPAVEASLFKTEVQVTEILSISPAQASIDVTSTGYVIPQSTAKVGANVIGVISKVTVTEGQRVTAGELLFQIERTQHDATIASARARVASAVARAKAAHAAVAEARVPYERAKKLAEVGAQASATVDDMAARIAALEEQAKAADAEAAAAQAEVNALNAQLDYYDIESPIDGIVQNKPAQVGDVVGPTFGAAPLVELIDPATLLVETDVPEARMHLIKDDQPCEIVLDSAPKQRWRGAVVDISPRINRSKATATVKVRFIDVPERLSPEMAARVSFLSKELAQAEMAAPPKIVVPKAAIVERAGGKAVFVIEDGKVRLVPIRVGDDEGDNVSLEDGPAPGTRIVKNPPATLEDGQAVKEGSS